MIDWLVSGPFFAPETPLSYLSLHLTLNRYPRYFMGGGYMMTSDVTRAFGTLSTTIPQQRWPVEVSTLASILRGGACSVLLDCAITGQRFSGLLLQRLIHFGMFGPLLPISGFFKVN